MLLEVEKTDMKVILSRKGFDSKYGGKPSPILPDGRLVSFPIPNEKDTVSYDDLNLEDGKTYFDLMNELGIDHVLDGKNKRIPLLGAHCHLDPDIYRSVLPRDRNWKPLFGQIDKAQSHLKNMCVRVDDLFLFFGWFKRTGYRNGKIVFVQNTPDLHIIFGYMQIGEIKKVDFLTDLDEWMQYHPHVKSEERKMDKTNNTLYVARDKLSFNENLSGAGSFSFNKRLVLTKDGFSRSMWDLDPKIFQDSIISHHPKPWKEGYFQSASIGQEFVIQKNDKTENWAKDLINSSYTS